MLSFDLSLVIFLFLSIHEMMVIFHDHSDIKSRAAPTGQRRTIYSSYFLAVITSCHSSSPSSSGPISVPSFQSKTSLFSSLYQGGARNGHLQTSMNESGPAHFWAVYRSGLVVIVREWEKRNMRSRDENPVLWTSLNISWFLPICSELRCRAERQVMVWDLMHVIYGKYSLRFSFDELRGKSWPLETSDVLLLQPFSTHIRLKASH